MSLQNAITFSRKIRYTAVYLAPATAMATLKHILVMTNKEIELPTGYRVVAVSANPDPKNGGFHVLITNEPK